jgi:parvulin-like peptidyl-prolyl isomerase
MIRKLLAVVVVAGLVATGCSKSSKPPGVAAVVEGADIKSADTLALYAAYQHRQTPVTGDTKAQLNRRELLRTILGYQIKLTFLEQLAKKQNVTVNDSESFDAAAQAVDPAAFQAFGLREEDFARSLRAGRLSKAIAEKQFPDVTVSDSAVHAEFDRRADDPFRPWKAKIKVARFADQPSADKVKERVAAGEKFDDVASVLGAQGGVSEVDVNPQVAELSSNILDAIGSVPVGQVSAGIQSTTGWLSILVEKRDTVAKPTFDQLRPDLTDYLVNQERARLFQEWFDKQWSAAAIKVDSYYGKWNAELHNVV